MDASLCLPVPSLDILEPGPRGNDDPGAGISMTRSSRKGEKLSG